MPAATSTCAGSVAAAPKSLVETLAASTPPTPEGSPSPSLGYILGPAAALLGKEKTIPTFVMMTRLSPEALGDPRTARKVSYLPRADGAVEAESWQAVRYDRYLKLIADAA